MTRFIRISECLKRIGVSQSTFYRYMQDGVMIRPVKIGIKTVVWPEDEIETICQAIAAGRSNNEVKALVHTLYVAREEARRKAK